MSRQIKRDRPAAEIVVTEAMITEGARIISDRFDVLDGPALRLFIGDLLCDVLAKKTEA
jgi:hypothetical protein